MSSVDRLVAATEWVQSAERQGRNAVQCYLFALTVGDDSFDVYVRWVVFYARCAYRCAQTAVAIYNDAVLTEAKALLSNTDIHDIDCFKP